MVTILIFILVISLLIVIHEAGHLIAAKISGVHVEEFSLGMGPVVARVWHDGATVYNIRAFPIGGFVRLFGEDTVTDPAQQQLPEMQRAFFTKPTYIRAFILTAGIVLNYIFGIFLIAFVFLMQGQPIAEPALQITGTAADSPAITADIKENDLVIGYGTNKDEITKIETSEKFISFVSEKAGSPIFLHIVRGEETLTTEITPRQDPPENQGALGIAFFQAQYVTYKQIAWWDVPSVTIKTSISLTGAMFQGISRMVGDLVTRGVVPNDVGGPAAIAKITGEVAKQGIYQLLQFIALISINLAVVNILPFPALDGGRLAFLVFEIITGRKPLPQYEGWIHAAGLVVLLTLMAVITYFDVQRYYLN